MGLLDKLFVLSRTRVESPDGWLHRKHGDLHLSHGPNLPVRELTVDGRSGLLLGWTSSTGPVLSNAELSEIGGRWVYLDGTTLRLDPLGSYSVVYHRDAGLVAATTAVMPAEALVPDAELNATLKLPSEDSWYPFGLTPYRDVKRLQPNHVLRLTDLRAERAGLAPAEGDDESYADTVARNLRREIQSLVPRPLLMGVTAGNETRMLLSALRGHTANVYAFTFTSGTATQDTKTAQRLAAEFGLRHDVRQTSRQDAAEKDWFELVGQCVAGQAMRNAYSKQALPKDRVHIAGTGGEISRGYYYRRTDRSHQSMEPRDLVERLHLPQCATLEQAADGWLQEVDSRDTFDLLDQLYHENRTGCWEAPQQHANLAEAVWPVFNRASTITAFRGLTTAAKVGERLPPLVVSRLWPELLDVPINTPLTRRGRVAAAGRKGVGAVRRTAGKYARSLIGARSQDA